MEQTTYKIGEIGTVVGGGTPSTTNESYWGGDIPWISPKDLTGYQSVYIGKGEKFLTDKGLKSGTKLLPKGTVLFSSRAPIGYIAIAANPICTNQGFKSIICQDDKVTPLYLYYCLKANMNGIKQFGSGATFPEISGKVMEKIKLSIFSNLNYQRKIASILSSYDSLIEANTRRIRLLEQMAENLYKEWFVRFRFPGHEKVKMVDGLPEGWKKKCLDEFCNIFTGKKNANAGCEDGKYMFFTCGSTPLKINSYIYDGAAIIVSGNGSYTGRTSFYEGKFDLYQRTYACTILNDSDRELIYGLYAIVKYGLVGRISGGLHGAAIPYIVMSDIAKFRFYYNKNALEQFSKIIKNHLLVTLKLMETNSLLSRQRDLLLPRLMSGKLEITL